MRRAAAIACAAPALAASVGLALSGASASVRPTPPDTVAEKGKLISDGVLTVGQPETVRVKGPAMVKLVLEVVANCINDPTADPLCVSAPIPRAAGAPRFRTDRKGRATLTFTPPDHYDLLNGINLIDRRPVPFTNGQAVVVRASGIHRARRKGGRKELIYAFAQSRAVVETAPPAPAP